MGATPIFDLEQEPPLWRSRRWVGIAVGAALGFVLAVSPGAIPRHLPPLNVLLTLPLLYIAVAVHELGHMIAGRIVGMPPGAIAIGGLVVFKSGPRWIVRFDYGSMLGGGLTKVLPRRTDYSRGAFAWMVAGGPLASLLLTAACGLALVWHGPGEWAWISTLFWGALLTVVMSLLPYSSGLNKSDGARLWTILRRPEQFGPWAALLALQTEETEGVTPRNWNAEVFERALRADGSTREYPYIQLLAFYRCLHLGDVPAALQHLEDGLATSQRCGKGLRQHLFLEAAWASARIRRSVPQARAWLAHAGDVAKPLSTDAVEAAIAICERRYSDARGYQAAFRARLLKRKLASGLALFALERVEDAERLGAQISAR